MKLKKLHTTDKEVQTAILIKTKEQGTAISLQIDAKKVLKKHITKVPAVLVCISGKATYKEENKTLKLKKGSYVMIPANVIHEVIAKKKSNFILIK